MERNKAAILARARGAFLGVAVGDALGATTEFMTPAEIRSKFGVHRRIIGGGWLHLKPGRVTDDTEMSLCLARAILKNGRWDLKAAADEFLAWMRGKPVDIGSTVRRGIRDYLLKGQLETPPNAWDAGNGAVMRMLPVALFTLGDDELFRELVVAQAHLTHNHPLSDAACVTVGRMVQAALLGADRFALHAMARELVARHPAFRFNDYSGRASGYVVETMQTVLHFLFTTGSFEECLIGVVNQGSDADTTGAIAGMIAGALYGEDAIPAAWLKRLDPVVNREVTVAAAALVRQAPYFKQPGRGERNEH
ncbi:MAG: ADP-ribosyl-[dinitrogen reductase] hydrolase [Desulfuromonadales bacterium]|nr:ADP-ribosyl-[dinitrogen reductase] hydrolase [Desulfuromonadales bacterium]